jgi:hypothetical protein
LEYCALFGVVLLHEFGHAFACRQTGGEADTIVLWPLGGIASSNLQLDLALTCGVSQPGLL